MVIDEPKKKSSAPLIILMFLIGIGLGFGANYGISYFNKDADKKESSVTEDTTKTKKLELTESTKAKMEMIILSGGIAQTTGNWDVPKKFFNGTDQLDNQMKYVITWNFIKYYIGADGSKPLIEVNEITKMDTSFTEEQLKNYSSEDFYSISKSGFDSIYKSFFNEEPNYTIKDLADLGCPSPMAIDSKNDRLLFVHACGGTGGAISSVIKSYESDENTYMAHVETTESYADAGDTVHKVLWKFDKDLNFISTEKE